MMLVTLQLETDITCDFHTCCNCKWVYGEAVGDPYCGLFANEAHIKPSNAILGKYKTPRDKLVRLPECKAAEIGARGEGIE